MLTTPHAVTPLRLTHLREEEALAAGELLAAVFPKPDRGPVERAEQLKRMGQDYDGPAPRAPISFVVWSDGRAIAHAMTFARTIAVGGRELVVMALAMVASDPDRRGEGLGAAVTRAAFGRIDAGDLPSALFQTSHRVRPFYEQIGCRIVENRIVNSLSEGDPEANPFWDDVVMRYPASAPWPDGVIDLRGRGY